MLKNLTKSRVWPWFQHAGTLEMGQRASGHVTISRRHGIFFPRWGVSSIQGQGKKKIGEGSETAVPLTKVPKYGCRLKTEKILDRLNQ